MKTELVCPCGRRLEVSVRKRGWLMSLIAVALASRWKVCEHYEAKWGKTIDAYCPDCHQ